MFAIILIKIKEMKKKIIKCIKCFYSKCIKYPHVSISILVFIILVLLWIFCPCFVEFWFGSQERTKFEILTYISAIPAGLFLIGNLIENTRRNNLTQDTINLTQKSIQLTEKSNMDIRFKDAATLLGSNETSSMFSGIFALHQIAFDCSFLEKYEYITIIRKIFCEKVRENKEAPIPSVIQIILDCLVKTDIYVKDNASMNFNDANLTGADLSGANLKNATFIGANLKNVDFSNYINIGPFTDYYVRKECDSIPTILTGADFQSARFNDTVLPSDKKYYHLFWEARNNTGYNDMTVDVLKEMVKLVKENPTKYFEVDLES
jgi:Uncharacterized low-complexity proteins